MAQMLVPLMSEAASLVIQNVLPDLIKAVEGWVKGGATADEIAAKLRLAYDTADLAADIDEDIKFGKPDPYTP